MLPYKHLLLFSHGLVAPVASVALKIARSKNEQKRKVSCNSINCLILNIYCTPWMALSPFHSSLLILFRKKVLKHFHSETNSIHSLILLLNLSWTLGVHLQPQSVLSFTVGNILHSVESMSRTHLPQFLLNKRQMFGSFKLQKTPFFLDAQRRCLTRKWVNGWCAFPQFAHCAHTHTHKHTHIHTVRFVLQRSWETTTPLNTCLVASQNTVSSPTRHRTLRKRSPNVISNTRKQASGIKNSHA